MKKDELLNQYTELIKEIAGEIYSQHVQNWGLYGQKTPKFEQTFNEYIEANNKSILKEYEILSFIKKDKKTNLASYLKNFTWCKDEFYCDEPNNFQHNIHKENKLLSYNWLKIHSIKRIRDNEIFTIGDNLDGGFSIDNIYIENSQIYFRINTGVDGHWYSQELKSLTKVKNKLFTTKDGIDIFGGETLYYINTNLGKNMIIDIMTIGKSYNLRYKEYLKYFIHLENAHEYLIHHKPLLNFNEIHSIIDKICSTGNSFLILDEVKSLIKNKLNLDK